MCVEAGYNHAAAVARAAYVAEVLGCAPPARLVDEEDRIAPEVIEFSMRMGASLDFIFMGDLRSMVLADSAARRVRFLG